MNKTVKICIAIPCFAGQLHSGCVQSLINLCLVMAREGLLHRVQFYSCSNIATGRNELVTEFLESEGTHLLFCDADSEFPIEAVVDMVKVDKDIVSLAFAGKKFDWDRIYLATHLGLSAPDLSAAGSVPVIEGNVIDAIKRGLVQVPFVGMGLCLIKRGVFEKMKPVCGVYKRFLTNTEGYDFFSPLIEPKSKHLLGEDYSFCLRAAKVGIRPWYLSRHRTVHHGQHGYVFDPATLIDIDRRVRGIATPEQAK